MQALKRVPRALGTVFGVFWEVFGIAKTCDSVEYIFQKAAFQSYPVLMRLSVVRFKRFGPSASLWSFFCRLSKEIREHLVPFLVSSGRSLALPKLVIPYSTSLKNQLFKVIQF